MGKKRKLKPVDNYQKYTYVDFGHRYYNNQKVEE